MAGYRNGVRVRRGRPDASLMTRRPWLEKHEAKRQAAMDARRISSYVYARVLAGESVTLHEVAALLANCREYVDTSRGTRRPTEGECERARFALETLCKHNKQLRRFVVLREAEADA